MLGSWLVWLSGQRVAFGVMVRVMPVVASGCGRGYGGAPSSGSSVTPHSSGRQLAVAEAQITCYAPVGRRSSVGRRAAVAGRAQSAGCLAWGNGGEGADVVAAVVGVQGYPDTASAGAGADVVLARQRGLHLVGRGSGVPERYDVPGSCPGELGLLEGDGHLSPR